MKIRHISLLVAALALPLCAQETASSAPAELTAAEQAEYAEQKALCTETLNLFKESVEVLKQVKDKASAEAAAPRMKAILAGMVENNAKAGALGRPGKAVELKIVNEFEPQLVQLMNEMESAVILLEGKAYYGSETLKEVLSVFFPSS